MKLTDNLYFYPEKGMLDCNTYIIKDDTTVLIDPGHTQFLLPLIQDLHKDGINPDSINIITNTHLHIDHYWANEALKKNCGAKIISHPLQKKFYKATVVETSKFFGLQAVEFKADSYLKNDKLNTGEMEFELIHSPGHSPDSICFYERQDKILICGDVIFEQNTGRADLPGGNGSELKHSIDELSQLEIEYLLPGHMGIITGAEKVRNNFKFVKDNIFGWL